MSGAKDISYFNFATQIAVSLGLNSQMVRLVRGTDNDNVHPATLNMCSTLDTTAIEQISNFKQPNAQDIISRFLEAYEFEPKFLPQIID